MLKQKNKKNTKKLLLSLLAALLFAGLLFVVLEKTNVTNFIKDDQPAEAGVIEDDGPTPEQKQEEEAVNAANKDQLIQKEGSQPTGKENTDPASKTIGLSAQQESNNTVTVFTKLYNFSSGSCSLTVTNGSASNNQTAAVIYQAEYSICAGFSVPTSGLGAGTWNINLKVDSDGTSAAKDISFEVR